jgi:putative PIN family toxin of toxin-antitoxin system
LSVFRRLVFDTSTLVSSALRVGSLPHRAMAHALSIGELCVCASTLAELDEVLMRAKFDRYQPTEVRRAFADFVRLHSLFFEVSDEDVANVQPLCRDPKDNQFLALLQACDADVLVSSDADLLVLHPWNDVPIMTPAAFLGTVNTH